MIIQTMFEKGMDDLAVLYNHPLLFIGLCIVLSIVAFTPIVVYIINLRAIKIAYRYLQQIGINPE